MPGIYRLDLETLESEQLAAGTVRHVHVADELLAVVSDETTTSLARVPLDGGAVRVEPLPVADTLASASAGGYTFVVEYPDSDDTNRRQIRRLATDTEPELVLLDIDRTYDDVENSFTGHGDQLYWAYSGAIMRVAADGSESEPTWLRPGGDWSEFVSLGSGIDSRKWLLGVHDGEVVVMRNVESFFECGTWSNGDPRGDVDFGGGGVYTVSADNEPEARLIRGDLRTAILLDGLIYAQTLDDVIERIDPATGVGVPIATQTPDEIFGRARLAANLRTLFYEADGQIFGLDL